MTDLETQLRRGMDTYNRRRPVARPPLDEVLSRADDLAPVPAPASRPGAPRLLLTAAGIVAVAGTVVGVAAWRGEPDGETTAASVPPASLTAVACTPPRGPDVPGDSDEASPDQVFQVVVFLHREVTEEQRAALEGTFDAHPGVAGYSYFDDAASLEEFRRLFRRNQAMLDRIDENPDLLPTSYRLQLSPVGLRDIDLVAAELGRMDGVVRAATAPACE